MQLIANRLPPPKLEVKKTKHLGETITVQIVEDPNLGVFHEHVVMRVRDFQLELQEEPTKELLPYKRG